jgi:hypothetical protein
MLKELHGVKFSVAINGQHLKKFSEHVGRRVMKLM